MMMKMIDGFKIQLKLNKIFIDYVNIKNVEKNSTFLFVIKKPLINKR